MKKRKKFFKIFVILVILLLYGVSIYGFFGDDIRDDIKKFRGSIWNTDDLKTCEYLRSLDIKDGYLTGYCVLVTEEKLNCEYKYKHLELGMYAYMSLKGYSNLCEVPEYTRNEWDCLYSTKTFCSTTQTTVTSNIVTTTTFAQNDFLETNEIKYGSVSFATILLLGFLGENYINKS